MSEIENDVLYKLDSRVDNLAERTARIEGEISAAKHISVGKLILDYGGVVALIISILTGGFTLYDAFLLRPAKERHEAAVDLRNDLNQLANINNSIVSLDWSNPSIASARAQTWTPQKLALLEKIKIASKVMPADLKFADRLTIAQEYENFSRFQEALNEADLAFKVREDSIQEANALWTQARLNGKINKLTTMRELFLNALDVFKATGMKSFAGVVMQVYTQWISLELINGNCGSAKEAHAKMVKDLASPDVWQATRIETIKQFNIMLAQSPKTCDLTLTLP